MPAVTQIIDRMELPPPPPPLEFRIVVTPPEDGDRKPERGERKGKIIKMEKGRLAPPEKTSKAKKDWDRHRRESRKQKALAQR
ncbi:hypothetical protein HBH56_240030 [Parastagonospora nodorum]|nr:hypothetical protein HBH56_240030 [Parastagonospora nodorum]KAH3954814.1 hypothetical protein HBH53_009980 [Parastagonospora nodorum]KAH3986576.1 hypothetical protein HBH52_041170 [Parastagonospora nodorum]KAH3988173.1 hypothetical protein HBH51_007840 [Parastagonospora nodorum]KAH4040090.1 hypothetical protein HBI09_023530 [Parastagonospora nodorum]